MSSFRNPLCGILLLVAGVLGANRTQAMQTSAASNPNDLSTPAAAPSDVVVLQAKASDKSIDQLQAEYQSLEQQCVSMATDLRSDKSGKPINQQELVDLVQRTFELRQQLQLAQLAASARRLERVQQAIEMRQGIKALIVQRRVDELLKPGAGDPSMPESKVDSREADELKIYELSGSSPDLVFRIMSQQLAGAPDVRMELDKDRLVVQARPSVHKQVVQLLKILSKRSPDLEAIDLKTMDVAFAVATIKKFFGLTDKATADSTLPVIDGDMINRRLLVKGTPTQIEQVRSLVEKLESNTTGSDNQPVAPKPSSNPNDTPNKSKLGSEPTAEALRFQTTGAGVNASDLLRTTPAEMRKMLYEKAVDVNSIHVALEVISSQIQNANDGDKDHYVEQQKQALKNAQFKEDELRFALLQYEQIMSYLRAVEADTVRKIEMAAEEFRRNELMYQRGSLSQSALNEAKEKTHAFDVERKRIESLLKLYEAAGDLPGLALAKQKLQEKKTQSE